MRLLPVILMCVFAQSVHAQQLIHLFDFPGSGFGYPDGATPSSTLLEVAPGIFYGTTAYGGANGCGTLFSITVAGVFSKLYDFPSQGSCSPVGALVQSKSGMLYGVETGSGYSPDEPASLFQSDLSGNVSTVATFGAHQALSAVALTAAPNGSLYVALTRYVGCLGGEYCTTAEDVVRYSPDGSLVLVKSFSATSATALTAASDGNVYGAAFVEGGILLFQVSGNTFSKVKLLDPQISSNYAVGLSEGIDKRFYFVLDTAIFSTALDGSGYQLVQALGAADPSITCIRPETGLTLASDGALYGGCYANSSASAGTIFRIASTGKYSEVYTKPLPDGEGVVFSSVSGLAVQGGSGFLIGEASGISNATGPGSSGFIYALDLGLPKPK